MPASRPARRSSCSGWRTPVCRTATTRRPLRRPPRPPAPDPPRRTPPSHHAAMTRTSRRSTRGSPCRAPLGGHGRRSIPPPMSTKPTRRPKPTRPASRRPPPRPPLASPILHLRKPPSPPSPPPRAPRKPPASCPAPSTACGPCGARPLGEQSARRPSPSGTPRRRRRWGSPCRRVGRGRGRGRSPDGEGTGVMGARRRGLACRCGDLRRRGRR